MKKNIICTRCGELISAKEIGSFGYKRPICKQCERKHYNEEPKIIIMVKSLLLIVKIFMLLPYALIGYFWSLWKK